MAHSADVFVSYSREDKEKVLAVISELKEAGVSLWIDQGGIDAATIWGEEIVNAIEHCKVLLLMISENSVGSQNVMREVMLISEKKKHILPVHLTPTTIPPTLKYPLAGIQHVEYFRGSQSENLNTIVRSLQRVGVELNPKQKEATQPTVDTIVSNAAPHTISSEVPAEWSHTIAILPFENLSPDKETDYFSDGLTEELIASLSNIKEIEVVSRRASVKYKGTDKDDRTIGRELGARYLCGGSVRKFQDNLRITAQLVDAEKGKQLWADTYKGGLEDVFDIQEKVSKEIADALKLKLSISEKISLTKRPTDNAEAFDLYLRGKDYLYRFTKRTVGYAIELFEKAIELDSRYAAAYAGCAQAYGQLYSFFERIDSNREKAQELSFKALMYDNTLPEAYATLGFSYYLRGEYQDALSACNKAVELDLDNFSSYWILGRIFYATDRYEDAIHAFEKVTQLNPKFYAAYNDLKLAYNALHDSENADRLRDTIIDFFPSFILQYPDDARARMIYACNLAEVGRKEESVAQLTLAVGLDPNDSVMMFNAACTFAQLGETRKSVEMVKSAISAGYQNFDWIKRDSDLDPVRSDPEYIALMEGR